MPLETILTILEKTDYALELFAGELVLFSFYPKKKYWPLRLLPFLLLSLALSELCFSGNYGQVRMFFLLLLIIAVTALGMGTAFEVSSLTVIQGAASAVALQHIAHHLSVLVCMALRLPWSFWWELGLTALIVLGFGLGFSQRLREIAKFPQSNVRTTVISGGILLICIGLTRITRLSSDYSSLLRVCISIYSIVCCVMALLMQYYVHELTRAVTENAIFQRIRAEEQKQYAISRDTSAELHIIYHDLKHKLRDAEKRLPAGELETIRTALNLYSATYQTGLASLDVVLNEKSMYARAHGVTLTFMGDGREVAFLDEMDIYSLFGNLLDNAIAAVEKLDKEADKLVSLIIERRGDFKLINITNYYGESLSFSDGLPVTTKQTEPGFHGYGLKSIRRIARKYGGDLQIAPQDGIFRAVVYLMDNEN